MSGVREFDFESPGRGNRHDSSSRGAAEVLGEFRRNGD
jgi:hypothetical protein